MNEIETESFNDVTTTSPNERTAQYFATNEKENILTNEKQEISTNELPELSANIKTEVLFANDDEKVDLDEEEIDLTTMFNDIADGVVNERTKTKETENNPVVINRYSCPLSRDY